MSRSHHKSLQQQQKRPLLVSADSRDQDSTLADDELPVVACTTVSETAAHTSSGAAAAGSGSAETATNGRQGLGKRSSTGSLRNAWKLKYQDFLPAKPNSGHWEKSEPFQKLVDRANEWLKRNHEVQVKTCETITWMSSEQKHLGDSEQMVLSKSIAEGTNTFFLRGLRLWLAPRTGHKLQTLSYTDISPESADRIQDLVSRANRKIEHKHLKGRILTIETISVPISKGHPQVNVTRWSENVEHDSHAAFALRIFTNKESTGRIYGSEKYLIGIKDMVPLASDYGYEGFELLTDRTNTWLKDQTDIVIINMQSVMVQKDNGPHSDMGSGCFYSMPGINNIEPIEFFRILRIAFIKPLGDLLIDLPIVYPFTYETFTPELVRQKESGTGSSQRERLEKMKETFSKVIAFLRNSGADVICSETVMNPMQMYIEDIDGSTPHDDEMRFLFTIRLFLTGQIGQLVDGSTRLIKRASLQPGPDGDYLSGGKEKPELGRAPLFLRHVVGRQFKYRWLVLALSAFTCMTIIVALSVVYSNR